MFQIRIQRVVEPLQSLSGSKASQEDMEGGSFSAVVRASSQTALESAALRLVNMAADCTALCHICRQKGWPESKTASMQQEANHLPVR